MRNPCHFLQKYSYHSYTPKYVFSLFIKVNVSFRPVKLNYVTRGSGSLLWIAGFLAKGIKKKLGKKLKMVRFLEQAAREVIRQPLQLLGGEGGSQRRRTQS